MKYFDAFCEFLVKGTAWPQTKNVISQEIAKYISAGNQKDAAKAQYCLQYYTRFQQYNQGKISRQDLFLFIRDFILYVGRCKMPQFVTSLILQDGQIYGLSVASDGAVDATAALPEWLGNRQFVEQVYNLGDDAPSSAHLVAGDTLLRGSTIFANYRSIEQKVAIHAAVDLPADYTMMVSLPTGGGKSLITQIVSASSPNLTLVIVPTVALAMDQYTQAKHCLANDELRSKVFCYRGNMDDEAVLAIIKAIQEKSARLLFTSPEAILKSIRLNKALLEATTAQTLNNVVIDEAHIVPDWGVYFRPDFQIFSAVLKEWRKDSNRTIRVFLLSATLSEDVVTTLFDLFGQKGRNLQIRCDTLRKEPRYIFAPCRNYKERDEHVIKLIELLPKPMIVYVTRPAEAERYRKLMCERGYKNIHTFTGETTDKKRQELLNAWKQNEIDVMIANSAFGIGVDKGNVRTIIHACVPENLSRFYQEVGRAGRDGLPSLSVMVPYLGKDEKQSDLGEAFGLVSRSILGEDRLVVRWFSIKNAPKTVIDGDIAIVDLSTAPDDFTQDQMEHVGLQNMTWNVNMLLLLQRKNYIDIQSAKYDVENRTYFFTVKMKEIELLNDKDALRAAIAPDRKAEYDARVSGYQQMRDLIHHPTAKCWGKRLTALYPYAAEVCQGCPVHSHPQALEDDEIKIRIPFEIPFTASTPNRKLKRLLGGANKTLVITSEDSENHDENALVIASRELDLSAVVVKRTEEIHAICNGMLLSFDEFRVISQKAPWLFSRGVLISFGEDSRENNTVFDAAYSNALADCNKVLCCREDMFIYSKNKSISEFLDYRMATVDML
jgi:ATP-dependent DNA helicase RecQ